MDAHDVDYNYDNAGIATPVFSAPLPSLVQVSTQSAIHVGTMRT